MSGPAEQDRRRARDPEVEDEEGEDDDESRTDAQIEDLLGVPFDEALRQCEALRVYIQTHEDASELIEEFRAHWHPGAPAELQKVLEEILDPEMAAIKRTLSEAFLRDPVGTVATTGSGGAGGAIAGGGLSGLCGGRGLCGRGRGPSGGPPLGAAVDEDPGFDDEPPRVPPPRQGPRPDLEEEERDVDFAEAGDDYDDEDDGSAAERVGALLGLPLEQALDECEELRRYLAELEDREEVEEEFREHWGPEGPRALRRVLEELLDARAAARAEAGREAFKEQMAGYRLEEPGSQEPGRKEPRRAPEQRSKL